MAALTGCVSARLLDQLRSCKLSAGRVVVWGGAGVICILVLKLSLLCGVLVIAAAYALYRRKQESVSVLLCGILVAGTIYLVVFGMASAGSLHADYIAQEHLQEEVMEKCISYGRQNRTIGVIGDASDERFGSTQYFAEQEGSHLQFRSVKSTPDLQQVDLLLRIPNEGSPFSLERSLPLTRIASLGGTVTIDEPVSYWTWRRNLWHGKLEYLTDTKLDRLWIFYGPDAKRARMKSKGR
jgi:hypothetical protein